jgi:hypothetical protein
MFTAEDAFNYIPEEIRSKYQARKAAIVQRLADQIDANDWDADDVDDTHENISAVISDAVKEWETNPPTDVLGKAKLDRVKDFVIKTT